MLNPSRNLHFVSTIRASLLPPSCFPPPPTTYCNWFELGTSTSNHCPTSQNSNLHQFHTRSSLLPPDLQVHQNTPLSPSINMRWWARWVQPPFGPQHTTPSQVRLRLRRNKLPIYEHQLSLPTSHHFLQSQRAIPTRNTVFPARFCAQRFPQSSAHIDLSPSSSDLKENTPAQIT